MIKERLLKTLILFNHNNVYHRITKLLDLKASLQQSHYPILPKYSSFVCGQLYPPHISFLAVGCPKTQLPFSSHNCQRTTAIDPNPDPNLWLSRVKSLEKMSCPDIYFDCFLSYREVSYINMAKANRSS